MSFKYFKFIQRVIIDKFNREYGKRNKKKGQRSSVTIS